METKMNMNRIHNLSNPYQGDRIKTLCVCSAGLLRSPTLAMVLSIPPYNRNTRAVGYSKDYALIPMEQIHTVWADEIVCVDGESFVEVKKINSKHPKVIQLTIPDVHTAFSERLIEEIKEQLLEAGL